MQNPPAFISSLFAFDAASNTFTAEASVLGLAPGETLRAISIVSTRTGNLRTFRAMSRPLYHGAGEDRCVAGWKFILGGMAVVVLNT